MLHKTAKKANTLNPEWNEQFSFYLMDQSGPIIFKVFLFSLKGFVLRLGLTHFAFSYVN